MVFHRGQVIKTLKIQMKWIKRKFWLEFTTARLEAHYCKVVLRRPEIFSCDEIFSFRYPSEEKLSFPLLPWFQLQVLINCSRQKLPGFFSSLISCHLNTLSMLISSLYGRGLVRNRILENQVIQENHLVMELVAPVCRSAADPTQAAGFQVSKLIQLSTAAERALGENLSDTGVSRMKRSSQKST